MTPLAAPFERPDAPLFSDGLGDRVFTANGATGDPLQILRLRPALTAVPSFEFALRERTARLANFRHAYFSRVRRIDRAMSPTPSLSVVSDHVEGIRLSEMLRVARDNQFHLDINAALCLIRQLVPAVSLLHENARDVAHGVLSPERLVVTPHARLIIVEHVLGAAIEQLRWSRERLWREFRVAVPPTAGLPRFDHRADVVGIGVVALALVLGRPLDVDEFPQQLPALLEGARERSSLGELQPLSPGLASWLSRALYVDVRRAFGSAPEALAALDEVIGEDSGYVAAPIALETFLSRYLARPEPGRGARPERAAEATFAAAVPAPVVVVPPPPAPVGVAPPPALAPAAVASAIVAFADPAVDSAPVVAPAIAAAPAPASARGVPALADIVDLSGLPDLDFEPPAATAVLKGWTTDERDRVVPPFRAAPAASMAEPPKLFDAEEPFSIETPATPAAETVRSTGRSRRIVTMVATVLLLAALGGGAYAAYMLYGRTTPAMGTLVVQSTPTGAQVFVDGVGRGVTPARLTVAPGAHILELRGRGVPRVIPLNVTAGAEVSQYLEFAEAAAAPLTGQLTVQSNPAGARVFVDGIERGVAPITIADLAPGEHQVVLQSEFGSVKHVAAVQAGATASLLAPMSGGALAGPVSGWISVPAPFNIEIHQDGRLIGTTDTERVMMAAGKHDLEFVNAALGLRLARTVQVTPGRVTAVPLELPSGTVHVNATPWAEVWIDGRRAGETPLGNVPLTVGPHEIVFRHPQFGEKRHAVSVTLGAPVRVSMDMKQ